MERFKKIGIALLYPHKALILLLSAASAAGLVWVFATGNDQSWFAYPIYILSFYALVTLCAWLIPVLVRFFKASKKRRLEQTPEARQKRFRVRLQINMVINLCYAAFNLISALVLSSPWLGSNSLYYLVNTLIHFVMFRYARKLERLPDAEHLGWSCFQLCGVLMFVLHLTMTGIVFQMIRDGKADTYPGYLVLGVAAYTFYKLTVCIIRVARSQKNGNPIWSTFQNIDLSEAMMSLFSLQTALFAAFGEGFEYEFLMNCLTGGTVCFLTMFGAVGMIFYGGKRKKQ